ncbi:MAG: hypothetical protein E6J77_12970 [Deltaproteobacteria bacterium]|nr:MAG: hypothetical protein E6J77_12970 [Deltaproteobacteria bacterium]
MVRGRRTAGTRPTTDGSTTGEGGGAERSAMSRHFAGGGGGPSALLVLDSEAGVIPSPPPRGSCRCTRRACRRTPRYYSFFLFLARTGLRLGEARSVRWGDLDLERREVRVERTVADESKRIGTPKAGHARTADLSRALVTALRHLEVESKGQDPLGVQEGAPGGAAARALHAPLAPALLRLDPDRRGRLPGLRPAPAWPLDVHPDSRYLRQVAPHGEQGRRPPRWPKW